MYGQKALLVKIKDTDYEKLCSMPKEAEVFLKKCNLPVTQSSIKHLERIFRGANHVIHEGEPSYSFSDGGDSSNPTVLIYNYTGQYSKREFSPCNLQQICDEIAEKYSDIEEDFSINMSLDLIEGGFNWRWSDQRETHFAIHDFSVRPCYYANLTELKEVIEQRVIALFSKYSQNL